MRISRMLQHGCPFHSEMKTKIIPRLLSLVASEMDGESEDNYNDAQLMKIICSAMESFLCSYPTRAIFKQHLKERLILWIRAIEGEYCLPPNNLDHWLDFVQADTGIELVKSLHSQSACVTKQDLRRKLGLTTTRIATLLRKLDPTLSDEPLQNDTGPLRVGGHALHVPIRSEQIKRRGDLAYYTPNTLHPIVLQLNVTQTATTLMALQNAYDRGEYGTYCLDVALDLWCQLSDYCKNRIREIFTPYNDEFRLFLTLLDDELAAGHYPTFKTERIMAENGTPYERLEYAVKSQHLCNIRLKINGQVTTYQKKRIFKNESGRYGCASYDAENPCDSAIYFAMDNFKGIEFL